MGDRKGTKVYVGNLNPDANERDLRDMFERFGNLTDVWVARKPPGFGFVWYDDPRDADDAVRDLDNRELLGKRVRVEISSSRGPGARGGPGGSSECYECGGRGHFARECPRRRYGGGGGRRRSPSPRRRYRSRSRSPRRSRSRSPYRGRSRSRSPRDRSPPPRRRSPSRSPARNGSPPPARGRSVSPPRRSPSPRRSLTPPRDD